MKKSATVIVFIFTALALVLTMCACKQAYSLSFESKELTVPTELSFAPNIKIKPKKMEYTISSSNPTIASVENNVVTSLKEGVVTLTVSSGKKSDTCKLYVQNDAERPSSGVILIDSHVINFEIVNYELAGLETGRLQSLIAMDGSFIHLTVPFVSGYIVDCWYKDRACTDKYNADTSVHSGFTLYAKLTERATSFNVVDGYITGLVYPNLKHEELILPEKEENGGIIYGVADKAFKGDKTIKRVVFPASYKTIGSEAFAGCSELIEAVIPEDSELHTIGAGAFGGVDNGKGDIADACEKLMVCNLPDSVTHLGGFAFYGCKSLNFDGIPSGLNILEQYAFAYTGINNVSLKNINALFEGVFFGCAKLDTVTESEGVTMCDKLVFEGTKLTEEGRAAYLKSPNDNDNAAYYADTILYGCYPLFGTGRGSGKLRIKETTTLIADEAFAGDRQSELTLYIDTEIADKSLDRDFIGRNVFCDSKGVFIVVGEGLSEGYRKRYSVTDRNYADKIVEEERITVNRYGNSDEINWGVHVVLKKLGSEGNRYYYDKFIPFEAGTPTIIRLGELRLSSGAGMEFERVNMNAFVNIPDLRILGLYRLGSIAYMGITNCRGLTEIDLTETINPTGLENALSIQFGQLNPDVKVLVKESDWSIYRSLWANYATAASKLEKAA